MKGFVTLIALFCTFSAFADGVNCEQAYRQAKSSASIEDVTGAADLCDVSAQVNCEDFVGAARGTSDGRVLDAVCERTRQKAANLAVTEGKGTEACLQRTRKDGSPGVLMQAALACEIDAEDLCANASGDARDNSAQAKYLRALCVLEAKYAGFNATFGLVK